MPPRKDLLGSALGASHANPASAARRPPWAPARFEGDHDTVRTALGSRAVASLQRYEAKAAAEAGVSATWPASRV